MPYHSTGAIKNEKLPDGDSFEISTRKFFQYSHLQAFETIRPFVCTVYDYWIKSLCQNPLFIVTFMKQSICLNNNLLFCLLKIYGLRHFSFISLNNAVISGVWNFLTFAINWSAKSFVLFPAYHESV